MPDTQLLKRELYKAQEKIHSAIASLNRGMDPKEVVQRDLVEALEAIEYLQDVA